MVNLVIGEKYHVYGWNFKAVFLLEDVNGNIATLKYPKRNKRTHAPIDKLFYAKKNRKRQPTHTKLPQSEKESADDTN